MKAVLLFLLFLQAAIGTEYLVSVGKNEGTGRQGLGFTPSVIYPAAGDTIAWRFNSGNHSVVQSTFENPCTYAGGIDTGVQPVANDIPLDASSLPVVHMSIDSKSPMWFFDKASGDCQKGAVFAVNPTQGQTADAFRANAAKQPPPPPTVSIPSPNSSSATSSGSVQPTKTGTSGSGAKAGSGATNGAMGFVLNVKELALNVLGISLLLVLNLVS